MKKRVMFVDDEPNILEGLKARLYKQRNKWEMRFVNSGKEALALLAQEPMDVLVTDMRMPEMDGATLLKAVQSAYPHIVRIVLSGHAEMESTLRAIQVAHQYLAKPCDTGVLENVVERACNLQALVSDQSVMEIIGGIQKLPSLPRVHTQIMTALSKDQVSPDDIAHILKQDMAMCAKVLQMVNSAFFRLSRQISKIEEAVNYLGFNTIKQVVLAVEVFQFTGTTKVLSSYLDTLQNHAMLVASVASALLPDKDKKDDASVAGLLHDIGQLIMAFELPELTIKTQEAMQANGVPSYIAEERVFGITHAEIGAYLLGIWGLPYGIVEAVGNHHFPSRVETNEFGILAAVHIANALVDNLPNLANAKKLEDFPMMDIAFIDRIGARNQLDDWKQKTMRLAKL